MSNYEKGDIEYVVVHKDTQETIDIKEIEKWEIQ